MSAKERIISHPGHTVCMPLNGFDWESVGTQQWLINPRVRRGRVRHSSFSDMTKHELDISQILSIEYHRAHTWYGLDKARDTHVLSIYLQKQKIGCCVNIPTRGPANTHMNAEAPCEFHQTSLFSWTAPIERDGIPAHWMWQLQERKTEFGRRLSAVSQKDPPVAEQNTTIYIPSSMIRVCAVVEYISVNLPNTPKRRDHRLLNQN